MNVIDQHQLMKAWGDLCTSGTGVVEMTEDGRVIHRRAKEILEMQEAADFHGHLPFKHVAPIERRK